MDAAEATSYWTGAYLEWLDGSEQRRLDVFRQAMAEVASRTERDCARIAEVLREAERLLEDEREAWRALDALRACDRRHGRRALPPAGAWEQALEGVASELHSLEERVAALQVARH